MADAPAIAAMSGVYSNHLALEQAIADATGAGIGSLWCLGDLGGFGPAPDRAATLLRARGVHMLRGNYDDSIGNARADCACGYADPRDNHFAQVAYDYTLARTSEAHRAWMRALPEQHRFEAGGRRVLLCHGSPRRVNEFLWQSTCSDAFLEWLCETHAADVLVCGHSGIHWHRALPSGRHVVNVGALGRPANDGRTETWYARLRFGATFGVEFRPVRYDHDALAREMEIEQLPREFIETIRTGWWTTCLENLPARERRAGKF